MRITLTGITDITSGNILIDGHDITNDAERAKENFGFVLDSPDMFLKLKGIEFLKYIIINFNHFVPRIKYFTIFLYTIEFLIKVFIKY
mgnify:CR=1 FL=1